MGHSRALLVASGKELTSRALRMETGRSRPQPHAFDPGQCSQTAPSPPCPFDRMNTEPKGERERKRGWIVVQAPELRLYEEMGSHPRIHPDSGSQKDGPKSGACICLQTIYVTTRYFGTATSRAT